MTEENKEEKKKLSVVVNMDRTKGYTTLSVVVDGTLVEAKRSHNKCLGRGVEGWNEKGEPILCSCVKNKVIKLAGATSFEYSVNLIDVGGADIVVNEEENAVTASATEGLLPK